VRGAATVAGSGGAVARVAVVADDLDCGYERAGGAAAGARAGLGPSELVREAAGGGVPDRLCDVVGGNEVDRGAVAVRLVAGSEAQRRGG